MFNNGAQRSETGLVAHATRAIPFPGPAAIPVHNDSNMTGYGWWRSHLVKLPSKTGIKTPAVPVLLPPRFRLPA